MAHLGHSEGRTRATRNLSGGHGQAMLLNHRPCKAPAMNGGEGLLIVIAVVVVGSLVTYAIVRISNRW